MKILKKVLVYLIFPLAIIGLAYMIVESVMEPVRFNNEKAAREQVAIQRLKDIRTLQNAYKTECGKFTASFDTLKSFFTDSSMQVVMQLGSADDSIAVANTEQLKKRNPRIKPEQMLELYKKGERLVFRIENEIPVRDTLFKNRPDFNLDSLAFVPFSQMSVAGIFFASILFSPVAMTFRCIWVRQVLQSLMSCHIPALGS